jgi:hypothetical protein
VGAHARAPPPGVAPCAARASAVLSAAARAVLLALSRAPVLRVRPGDGGLARLMQDAPLPRGARCASLLLATRHAHAPSPSPSPPSSHTAAHPSGGPATHLGLLALLALRHGAVLEVVPPGGGAAVRFEVGTNEVAVVAGETLHYATAGGVRAAPHRVQAGLPPAGLPRAGRPRPASLALRVHGEPAAALPAGAGAFAACDDVAGFERLRLHPQPEPQPEPQQQQQQQQPPQEAPRLGGGAHVTIIADSVTVTGLGDVTGGGGVAVRLGVRGGAGGVGQKPKPPRPRLPPPPPAPEGQVNLSIEDAAGGELRFLVPLGAPLRTLLDVFCAKRGVARDDVRFVAPARGRSGSGGGAVLDPARSVRDSGLRERDVIYMERA